MNPVHVGFNIDLGQDLLELIQNRFKECAIPSQARLAVLHKRSRPQDWRNYRNDTNSDVATMKQWYDKAKTTVAYLTDLYYYTKSRNPPKDTKFDVMIVAKLMIDGKPYYLNIFNNSSVPPIEVKKFLCSNEKAFEKIPVDRLELVCTPYVHEQ
jgi:hypothetical protein